MVHCQTHCAFKVSRILTLYLVNNALFLFWRKGRIEEALMTTLERPPEPNIKNIR